MFINSQSFITVLTKILTCDAEYKVQNQTKQKTNLPKTPDSRQAMIYSN